MTNSALFMQLLVYDFDEGYQPDEGLTFAEKLARNNNWTAEEADRAIEEYKRFMYLVITYGNAAPSDAVDQVWHQHILYTKDYNYFCQRYAGRFIHHSPDRKRGSSNEAYEKTWYRYFKEFQTMPGPIWDLKPANYVRVDLATHYMIPANSLASAIKLFFIILKTKLL